VHDVFLERLKLRNDGVHATLLKQEEMLRALSTAAQQLKAAGESRPKRILRLRAMLEQPAGVLGGLRSLPEPLMMPLDPHIQITSSLPEKAIVFKSAMSPLGLTFECAPQYLSSRGAEGLLHGADPCPPSTSPHVQPPPAHYSVIFKGGDDLRQDQLVIQMLMLMDELLQVRGQRLLCELRHRPPVAERKLLLKLAGGFLC
jgi:phosphatidylinositol 3-kinase